MDSVYRPLPPRPQPPPLPSRPAAPPVAPGVWIAFGFVALYFLMQIFIGLIVGVAVTVVATFDEGAQEKTLEHFEALLVQPDTATLILLLSMTGAALATLWLVRQKWPPLWSQGLPPGFGFSLPARPLFFVTAIGIGLVAPLFNGWLTQWLAHGQEVTQEIQQIGAKTSLGLRIPLTVLVISLGPLVEELLFRGVLLSALLRRVTVGWAVAISSLLFALVHMSGLDTMWFALPALALLGATLAWLRLRSGSIWPAVLAHGVNNIVAVTAWFVAVKPPG